MTKQQLIVLRDQTYQEPLMPPERCETCQYYCSQHGTSQCHLVADRRQTRGVYKTVHPLGHCELWIGR